MKSGSLWPFSLSHLGDIGPVRVILKILVISKFINIIVHFWTTRKFLSCWEILTDLGHFRNIIHFGKS